MTNISVIVPVYNAETTLDKCIQSLLNQRLIRKPNEIIMVDNNSTDRSGDIIKGYPVTYLYEPIPSSYRARNAAARIATGQVLAFLDSDCIADPGWLEAGVRWLGRYDIVGGQILTQGSENTYLDLYDRIITSSLRNLGGEGYVAKAGNLFIRQTTFSGLAGFEVEAVSGGDSILSMKARRCGYTLAYCPEAIVYHPVDSLARRLKRSMRIAHGAKAKKRHAEAGEHGAKQQTGVRPKLKNFVANFTSRVRLLMQAKKSGLIDSGETLILLSLVLTLQFSGYSGALALRTLRLLKKVEVARL